MQRRMIVANRLEVGQPRERKRGRSQKVNLEANLDRVAGDAAARVPRVAAKGQDRNLDHVCVAPDRDPQVGPSRAAAGNRLVDPSRKKDRVLSAGAVLDRAAEDTAVRTANRDQDPEHVALDPDENRVPEVAPSLAAVVTGGSATLDLLLLKSRVRDRERHRPSGGRAAVLGLCQSLRVGEVALGREIFPRLTLVRT